jgi:hypothetical protein
LSDETFNSGQSTAYLYANRIKEFFPDADVILTLRNQITTIESFYFGHSRILKGYQDHMKVDMLSWMIGSAIL